MNLSYALYIFFSISFMSSLNQSKETCIFILYIHIHYMDNYMDKTVLYNIYVPQKKLYRFRTT